MARKPKAAPALHQGGLFDDEAVVLSGFVPSAYQQAIFEWVIAGSGDGAVRGGRQRQGDDARTSREARPLGPGDLLRVQ